MQNQNLTIDYIPIDQLHAYKRNAKQHPAEQVQQIANSIREFGMNDPIAVDENNTIIEGHGRLLAVKKLIEAGDYPSDTVPVIRLEHLTAQQKRAYILAHNKLTLNSGFDLDILKSELDSIDEFNMADFGFLDDEFDKDDDDAEEAHDDHYDGQLSIEPKSKPGEIYRLGNHYLMCGDSTKEEDVKALLDAGGVEHVHLCMTDPPYNVAVENSAGMTIHNDNMGKELFREFLVSAFKNIDMALFPGSSFYIWYATASAEQFLSALDETALTMRQQLIWVKNAFTFGRQDYQWKHEPCLYGWKDGASHYFVDDRTQATVWDTVNVSDINKLSKADAINFIKEMIKGRDAVASTVLYEDRPQVDDLHPTMKPVPLIGKLIKNSSKKGQDVIDLFGGSGSTLIACEQLKRRCFTMEYDPQYVDAIIDRWEKYTGEVAEKVKGVD